MIPAGRYPTRVNGVYEGTLVVLGVLPQLGPWGIPLPGLPVYRCRWAGQREQWNVGHEELRLMGVGA